MIAVHPPQMPGPGGSVRTYHFAHALADAGDLTLVCLCGGDGKGIIDSRIQARCRQVIVPANHQTNSTNSAPKSRIASWLQTIGSMCIPWRNKWSMFVSLCLQHCPNETETTTVHRILGTVLKWQFRFIAAITILPPFSVMIYVNAWDRIWPQVAELLKQESFDVIWFENSLYFPFAKDIQRAIPGTPMVCNAQNIEFRLQERIAKLAKGSWNQVWENAQARFLFAMERDAFRESDLVINCSQEDMVLAKSLAPETQHCVIGNGVDIDYFRSGEHPKTDTARILFTGTFGYQPNRDGLEFFVEQVFPLILQRRPDCQFLFAGFDAQSLYDKLQITNPRILCISSPEDIRPCFSGVSVFVVPLRAGGGTRLKILEAMAMECAVVSTRLGAEGIPAEHGRHLLLSDSPEDFADSVVRLLDSPELRAKLQSESVTWVRKNYDWQHLCGYVSVHLTELLQN